MKDKNSKKLAKKLAKAQRKKNPTRKLKRNIIVVVLILLAFFSSRPLSALTAKSSFGNLSKNGAEVNKSDGISVKFVGSYSYKEAGLVEIDLLVDLPANKVNFQLSPKIYLSNKTQVSNVKTERINANFYAIFVPKSSVSKFQYYIALPEKGNSKDTIDIGNSLYGFTISPKNSTEKEKFEARKETDYAAESRKLLSEKYQKQLADIDKKIDSYNQNITKLTSENEELLANSSGLTDDEKKQVSMQIAANNSTISSLKQTISDLKASKNPIQDKIDTLKSSE